MMYNSDVRHGKKKVEGSGARERKIMKQQIGPKETFSVGPETARGFPSKAAAYTISLKGLYHGSSHNDFSCSRNSINLFPVSLFVTT